MGCQTARYFHAFSRSNMPLGSKKRVFPRICLCVAFLVSGSSAVLHFCCRVNWLPVVGSLC